MLSPEVFEDFIDYLKAGDGTWEEQGLVDDAPESAIKAYKKYLKMVKENKKSGVCIDW